MIQVKIKDIATNTFTHGAKFENEEQAQAWITSIESGQINPWGLPQRQKPVVDCTQEELDSALEIIPEVIGIQEEGGEEVEITPSLAVLPKTYEVIIEELDTTQEQINIESLDYLRNTDWVVLRHIGQLALGVPTSLTSIEYTELEQLRQNARDLIID
jgi:hypothetical protein